MLNQNLSKTENCEATMLTREKDECRRFTSSSTSIVILMHSLCMLLGILPSCLSLSQCNNFRINSRQSVLLQRTKLGCAAKATTTNTDFNMMDNNEIQKAIRMAVSNNQHILEPILTHNVTDFGVRSRKNGTVQRLEKELSDIKLRILNEWENDSTDNIDEEESIKEHLDILSSNALSNRNNVLIQEIGMEALQMQLDLDYAVKSSTILSAIRYLCNRPSAKSNIISHSIYATDEYKNKKVQHSIIAYRLLQRLVSGVGVEAIVDPASPSSHSSITTIREREICTVMSALVRSGNRNAAFRLLVLQERLHKVSLDKAQLYKKTKHIHSRINVPKVTAIGYSILIRAYAQTSDLKQIESLLTRAYETRIEPDIIFLNSVLDAYISCGAYDKADVVFKSMKKNSNQSLQPNVRSYNIMMKGMAKRADVKEALRLSSEMEQAEKHDAVSVNTLVNAMVLAEEFTMAESVLDKYAFTYVNNGTLSNSYSSNKRKRNSKHPHIEAYTDLLDGYAKANLLSRAFKVFDKMVDRDVTPNEVTYTCLVHALGLAFYRKRARKELLQQQQSQPTDVMEVMYNAYLSGLLSDENDFHKRMVEAISIFTDMMKNEDNGCRPNAVTAATLIEGLNKFENPKIADALAIAEAIIPTLEEEADITKVQTAVLQVYGKAPTETDENSSIQKDEADNFHMKIDSIYKSLVKKDVMALNAYLRACCRFRKFREAFKEFKEAKDSMDRNPDVVTYTILIKSLLTHYRDNPKAAKRAQDLYKEMKTEHQISPDEVLVDS